MGIGIGGTAGYTAAIFHILAHAVTKSQLFLSTPRLSEVSGNSLLFRKLQGAAFRSRNAGRFFAIGALSMIGIPVFAGFSSKILFGVAAYDSHSPLKFILVLLVLAVSSLLNALYFIRTLIRIYFDPDSTMKPSKRRRSIVDRSRRGYLLAGGGLSLLNMSLGLFSWVISDVIYKGMGMFL
jgi:multicomponent Na+:H+ antiporter subunit D